MMIMMQLDHMFFWCFVNCLLVISVRMGRGYMYLSMMMLHI